MFYSRGKPLRLGVSYRSLPLYGSIVNDTEQKEPLMRSGCFAVFIQCILNYPIKNTFP